MTLTPVKRVRRWVRGKIEGIVAEGIGSTAVMNYVPYTDAAAFAIPPGPDPEPAGTRHRGLPLPPPDLFAGYGPAERYVALAEEHVATMLKLLGRTGFALQAGHRVLDHGCAAGRMLRCLSEYAEACELWGTDITARYIYWCQRHLSPPFHFATTTTIPHLPFEDRYFTLIYAARCSRTLTILSARGCSSCGAFWRRAGARISRSTTITRWSCSRAP
jgi:hypothetical protein